MAVEVTQFLRTKFLSLLQEAENYPSLLPLIPHFKSIDQVIENNKNNIMAMMISSSPAFEIHHLLYDLIDLLSECRVFADQHKAAENKCLSRFNPSAKWFTPKMKRRLRQIEEKFGKIDYTRDSSPPWSLSQDRRTYPAVDASQIIGFDEEAAKIKNLLIGENGVNDVGFKAIGIVGMGGAGKTALAQKVFDSMKEFSPRIWVCLSETSSGKQVDVRVRVVKNMLEELGHDVNELTGDLGVVELLQKLNRGLLGKRYLIVLDDVWHINEWYTDLWHGLPTGGGGGVIVTSRLEQVARKMVSGKNLVRLEPRLLKELCLKIFADTVKKDRIVNLDHHILVKIGGEIHEKCDGLPLAAKTLAKIIPLQIRELESNRFLREFYIPDYILVPDMHAETALDRPRCPVLVFIDGQLGLGGKLLDTFRILLNGNQVFNLQEDNPAQELHKIYENLEKLKLDGDGFAHEIQKRLRIIVVGGDVLANQLLGTVCNLKLPKSPSIATTPLGSENHIPFSFGWGKQHLNADRQSVTSFLDEVVKAKEIKIDSWHIIVRMQVTSPNAGAHLQMPHSLHQFRPAQRLNSQNEESVIAFHVGLWNYFSMGIDAQRWRGGACFRPSSRTIGMLAKARIMEQHAEWTDLDIHRSIRSIVCLNLPSFPGGLNPWEAPNIKKERDRHLTLSYVDDGLLEIIGFRDAQEGHGTRLAQVRGIIFEFKKSSVQHIKMIVDGEEWKQQLTVDDGILQIEISHSNQAGMLATPDCQSRSIHDPFQPSDYKAFGDDSTEEDTEENLEEQRNIGAVNRFRI